MTLVLGIDGGGVSHGVVRTQGPDGGLVLGRRHERGAGGGEFLGHAVEPTAGIDVGAVLRVMEDRGGHLLGRVDVGHGERGVLGEEEHVVAQGKSREFAEAMGQEIARFPQACMRADRRSVYAQQGLTVREAMRKEWYNGIPTFKAEGAAGAARFASGKGRHGNFKDI